MDLSLGARLRAQREHRQVALEAIAEDTKINVALLEGLERDDVSRWPGGLFRRAYVRAYAQRIGLDPEQVVREFAEAHHDPVTGTSPVEAFAQNLEGKRPKTRIGLMLAGLAGLRPQRTEAARRFLTETFDNVVSEAAAAVVERAAPTAVEIEQPIAIENDPITNEHDLIANEHDPIEIEQDPIEIVENETPAPRLVMMASPETTVDARRDLRTIERSVVRAARLCTRIASARDEGDLAGALEETVEILDAQGAILWGWDADREVLFPALAHGYPADLLSRLPEVRGCADNAIAAALRCGQKQIVRGSDDSTGAFVAPLLTPDGCVGVLALEFANGVEQHEVVQALATIVSAQLSTVFLSSPPAAVEEWAEQLVVTG
jgi:hypothetical protein